MILMGIVFAIPQVTGGELGLSGLDRLSGSRLSGLLYHRGSLMLGLCTIMWKITDSNTGIIFHAIREDELAVRTAGINTTRYKLLAFCLSGFFAGISGGLYAHFMRIAGPCHPGGLHVFHGGHLGHIRRDRHHIRARGRGLYPFPVVGASSAFGPKLRMLMFALVILLILLYMPDGLLPWIRDKIETECPRCKIRNVATRKTCRVCTAAWLNGGRSD